MQITVNVQPITADDLQYMEAVYTDRWGRLQRDYNTPNSTSFLTWWQQDTGMRVTLPSPAVAVDATRRAIRRAMESAADRAIAAL